MNVLTIKTSLALFFFIIFINACSSNIKKSPSIPLKTHSIEYRIEQVKQLDIWQITGKVAFIEKDKRQSATLFWQNNQKVRSQKLTLSTYLGINVLSLTSKNGLHTVEVDGESYQSVDLEKLIYSLSGLTLPAEALQYWLKGISYLPSDVIEYDHHSNLPKQLTSQYNGLTWQIIYDDYQSIKSFQLAKKLTIQQDDLLIKIRLNQWTL